MPTKDHQGKIKEIEERYCKQGFKCKKNFQLYNPENNTFSLIDLACFKGTLSRAFEVEQSGRHVLKNARDLKRFKEIFKNAKICQLSVDGELTDCPDFSVKQKVIVKRPRGY